MGVEGIKIIKGAPAKPNSGTDIVSYPLDNR